MTIILLLLSCTTSTHDPGAGETGTETGDILGETGDILGETGETGDAVGETGDTDEVCPRIDNWTDNAKFRVGLTINWSIDGCGVPTHIGCDDAIAMASFSGDFQTQFVWSVAAINEGHTTCHLTLDQQETWSIVLDLFHDGEPEDDTSTR